MAWFPFKWKRKCRWRCVAVHHEEMPPTMLGPGGVFTHALMRCEDCQTVASSTMRGRFTVDQVNGVTERAVAEALIEASKQAPK